MAVVVDDHRAETYLVASVPVHVGDAIVVVALPVPGRAGRITVPAPALLQLVGRRIHVEGNHLVAGIDAACQEDARIATVQVGCAEEVLRRAVAIAVTPGSLQAGLSILQSLQGILYRLIGHARLTVDIHQILGTLVHEPVGTAASSTSVVLRGVADDVGLTVGSVDGGAVGSTDQGLGLAVLVPVVGHDVLFVVLEVAHVGTKVEPPQTGAVELHHLGDGVLAVVAVFRIAGTDLALVVELHQDLQLAVTIDICHTGIVGYEGRGQVTMVGRNLQPALAPHRRLLRLRLFLAAHYGTHGILTAF